MGERVAAAQQVGASRQIDRGLVRPGRRLAEHAANEHLPENDRRDEEDRQRERAAEPGIEPIDGVAEAIGGAGLRRERRRRNVAGRAFTRHQAMTLRSLSQASCESYACLARGVFFDHSSHVFSASARILAISASGHAAAVTPLAASSFETRASSTATRWI